MNGYVIEIRTAEELAAMIAGDSPSTIHMRRAEAASDYAFKPLEMVELFRSHTELLPQHVLVPEASDIENIRELLQFTATSRGDGDVSHVIPPAVRIVPLSTLWSITGKGVAGVFFQDIGEVWMAQPAVCSVSETNQEAWFNATLIHELTHFLQLRAHGFDIRADLAVDLCDREFEAVRAQRQYLLSVGNKSWLTREMDEYDLREIVEEDYGLHAMRVACAIRDPNLHVPEYKGPRS